MNTFMVLLRAVSEIVMFLLGSYALLNLVGVWAAVPMLAAFGVLVWYTEKLEIEDLV